MTTTLTILNILNHDFINSKNITSHNDMNIAIEISKKLISFVG